MKHSHPFPPADAKRTLRQLAIAEYAKEMAGSEADLDKPLEIASLELLMETD